MFSDFSSTPPSGGAGGGETFFQRQRRLAGQQQAAMGKPDPDPVQPGQPVQPQPTDPYPGEPTHPPGGPYTSPDKKDDARRLGGRQNPEATTNYTSPVMGNGKIPPPQPPQQAALPQVPQPAADGSDYRGPVRLANQVAEPNQQLSQQQAPAPRAPGGYTKPEDQKSQPVMTHPGPDLGYTGPAAGTQGTPSVPNDPKFPGGQQPATGPYLGPAATTNSVPTAIPGQQFNNTVTPGATTNTAAPTAAPIAPTPQVPMTAQPSAPAYEDIGNGMARFPDGQVLPMNHPLFLQRTGQTPGATPAAPAAPAAPGATPGATPPQAAGPMGQQLQDLVNQIVRNPQTQSPQIVAQMKQKAAEEAMAAAQGARTAQSQDLASRGFSNSGGMAAAQQRKTDDAMQRAILGSNRDIDLGASTQNRLDELNAIQAGQGLQQANRDDYWRGQGLNLQGELGRGGLNLDSQRLAASNSQFGQNHALNVMQFLESQRQNNNGNALNWAQLGQNGQNQMIQQILAMMGGG